MKHSCHCQISRQHSGSWLRFLPPELRREIYRALSFRDALALSQASSFFRYLDSQLMFECCATHKNSALFDYFPAPLPCPSLMETFFQHYLRARKEPLGRKPLDSLPGFLQDAIDQGFDTEIDAVLHHIMRMKGKWHSKSQLIRIASTSHHKPRWNIHVRTALLHGGLDEHELGCSRLCNLIQDFISYGQIDPFTDAFASAGIHGRYRLKKRTPIPGIDNLDFGGMLDSTPFGAFLARFASDRKLKGYKLVKDVLFALLNERSSIRPTIWAFSVGQSSRCYVFVGQLLSLSVLLLLFRQSLLRAIQETFRRRSFTALESHVEVTPNDNVHCMDVMTRLSGNQDMMKPFSVCQIVDGVVHDVRGILPLTIAVMFDVPWLVRLLFQLGADVNHTSSTGITPLMRSRSRRIAEYLMKKNASILPQPNHRLFPTALHGLLHVALRRTINPDELGRVVELFTMKIVDSDPRGIDMRSGQGLTPLHIALCLPCESRSKVLAVLLRAGADPKLAVQWQRGSIPNAEQYKEWDEYFDTHSGKLPYFIMWNIWTSEARKLREKPSMINTTAMDRIEFDFRALKQLILAGKHEKDQDLACRLRDVKRYWQSKRRAPKPTVYRQLMELLEACGLNETRKRVKRHSDEYESGGR